MRSAPHVLRASVLVLLAASTTATSGCADPQGEYDDFVQRWDRIHGDASVADAPDDATSDDTGTCDLGEPADVAPYYYMALSTMLAPVKPIMFLATVTWDGTQLGFSFQPLDRNDHKTPQGSPVVGGPFPVNPDGSFEADMGNISITGAANPISGSDIVAQGVLHGVPGAFCKPLDFICGPVTGIVSKPDYLNGVSLEGSNFTMTRMPDANTFPTGKVKINCAGDEALY